MSFSVNNKTIHQLLGYIRNNEIAIPEIQRPFVWDKTKVRDLIDSLYKKYPIGYIIIWNNPEAKDKLGKVTGSKKILIDGQQRITALTAAIDGQEIINDHYKKSRIQIAFNPFLNEEPFEVQTPAHVKDKKWISDISILFRTDFSSYTFINDYCKVNPEMEHNHLSAKLEKLRDILNISVGTIELDKTVEIDTVTEIFIRINSQGKQLDQADFVMSKLGADEENEGNKLRKMIDYFCHIAEEPNIFEELVKNDREFAQSKYLKQIGWIKNFEENLYNPAYGDLIKVSFMHTFLRTKLSDLVSLLSGRNFETKEYLSEIVKSSFEKLQIGLSNFVNENNFRQFTLLIKSMGFISNQMIGSKSALNFAYTLYLYLHKNTKLNDSLIKKIVQKWYLLTVLTSRYSSGAETKINEDLRQIEEKGIEEFIRFTESTELSDVFWDLKLVSDLDTSNTKSPTFLVYLAAQIFFNDLSVFSNSTTVKDLIGTIGDIHHIFPKAYLKKNGITTKNVINQVANYVYLDSQVNRNIEDKEPKTYFSIIYQQCEDKIVKLGTVTELDDLEKGLASNCIPLSIRNFTFEDYQNFLKERRKLMARKIKKFYFSF